MPRRANVFDPNWGYHQCPNCGGCLQPLIVDPETDDFWINPQTGTYMFDGSFEGAYAWYLEHNFDSEGNPTCTPENPNLTDPNYYYPPGAGYPEPNCYFEACEY